MSAENIEPKFTTDELGFIQSAPTEVLAAAARGEIDLNLLARQEMAARGLDAQGKWVGFKAASQAHKVAYSSSYQL